MQYLYFLLLSLIVFACTKEDSNLVNPPPPYQSIRVRLLNVVNSAGVISWGYNSKEFSDRVAYLDISKASMPPPLDSFIVELYQNGLLKYKTQRKQRFIRETRYLFIAGESFKSEGIVDTLMILSTTYGLPKKLGKTYLKFVNLIKDTTSRFSLVEGCPNGRVIVGGVPYFSFPIMQTLQFGTYVFSLIREDGLERSLVNIYQVNFEEDKEYTLFVANKKDGSIGLFLYDDYDTTAVALRELSPIQERASFVRVLNFSNESASFRKYTSIIIDDNIKPFYVSKYYSIPACESNNPDSLILETNSGSNGISYSFEIFKKYSLLVLPHKNENKLFIIPPAKKTFSYFNKSFIRVFNAVDTNFAFTLSLGARSSENSRGFISGTVLATNLSFCKISDPVAIDPGVMPLTLFSSTEPAILLKTFFTEVEPNNSYLLVIYNNLQNELSISLIPDEQDDFGISEISEGYFFQVVNSNPDLSALEIKASNLFKQAKLLYKESLASVIPFETKEIIINNQSFPINIDPKNQGLYVVSGDGNSIDLFDLSRPSMGKDFNTIRRRFFNSSKNFPTISINYDSAKGKNIVPELKYGQQSEVEKINFERKFSLVVLNSENNVVLSQFNDILLTLGKNYTLIFSGKKEKGFSFMVLQEY